MQIKQEKEEEKYLITVCLKFQYEFMSKSAIQVLVLGGKIYLFFLLEADVPNRQEWTGHARNEYHGKR